MARPLLLLVCAAIAVAADVQESRGQRRLALVIGNNAYTGQAVLQNARRDAAAMAAELRGLGFQTTLAEDVTRQRFNSAVETFANALTPSDIAIFYFAGHGAQAGGENYLIPTDYTATSESGIALQGIRASQVQTMLARARVSILVLDACRTNLPTGTRSGSRGLAAMEAQGSLVAFAAGAGQAAFDNPGGAQGTFMTALLDVMRTPGLSVREMFFQVRRRVHDETKGQQWPAVYDNLLTDVVLRPLKPGETATPPPPEPKPVNPPPSSSPPRASPAPEWMVGDFRGVNAAKVTVELTVHADGRVTGFVNPAAPRPTPVQYVWVAATSRMVDPTGAYMFDVERAGDGFRTREVTQASNTTTYRRMFIPPSPPAAVGARVVNPDARRPARPDEVAAIIAVINAWKPAWERADDAAGRAVFPAWSAQDLRADRKKRGVVSATVKAVTCQPQTATVRRDQATARCRAEVVETLANKPAPRPTAPVWTFLLVWNGTTWVIEDFND